mmetsp:Transcript_3701/g.8382  ORF Transcript_3701/g.8382 Transcript_3701/m.8382 type:complete len:250 (+) Transcript_3701:287-1036(+)
MAAEDFVDSDAHEVPVAMRLEQLLQRPEDGGLAVRRLVLDVEHVDAHALKGPHPQDGQLQRLDVDVDIVDGAHAGHVVGQQPRGGDELGEHMAGGDTLRREEGIVDSALVERGAHEGRHELSHALVVRHRRQHARRTARLAGDTREDGGVRLDADSGPAELRLEVPRVRVGDAVVAAEVDERAVPLACEDLLVDPLVLSFLAAVALLGRVRDGDAGRWRTVGFASPLGCPREATQSGRAAGRVTVRATG